MLSIVVIPYEEWLLCLSIYGRHNVGNEKVKHAHPRAALFQKQRLGSESFSNVFEVTPVKLVSGRAVIQTHIP